MKNIQLLSNQKRRANLVHNLWFESFISLLNSEKNNSFIPSFIKVKLIK